MTQTVTDADRARIAARYPARPGAHRAYVALGALLTVVLVGWMTWAGLHSAAKPVTADIHGFTIPSDTEARATLRVQRTHPDRAAVCTLQATAENFVSVGTRDVTIAPGTEKITLVPVSLKTVNRAVTVTVQQCHTA